MNFSHVVVTINTFTNNGSPISCYNIYEIDYWNSLKTFLKSYDNVIRGNIDDYELYIEFFGYDHFVNFIKESKISSSEYETFCNIMPTYFGDQSIFESIENLYDEKFSTKSP